MRTPLPSFTSGAIRLNDSVDMLAGFKEPKAGSTKFVCQFGGGAFSPRISICRHARLRHDRRGRTQGDETVLRMREFDRAAPPLQGFRGCLQDANELNALLAARERSFAVPDAIEEMLALGLQRFLLFDVGSVHVAIVIGVVKFGEGIVMRRSLHTHIKDADFFQGRYIVV